MRRGCGRLLLVAVFLWWANPGDARELWSRGEARVDFSGSLRERLLFTHQTDADDFAAALVDPTTLGFCTSPNPLVFSQCPAFDEIGGDRVFQNLTRLNLRLEVQAASWLSAVVAYDHELVVGELDTLERSIAQGLQADTFLGAEGSLVDTDDTSWRHSLYRGFVRLDTRHFELAVGRLRVPWGVGRLWNPIDRFNAVPPLALEPDHAPGIDGIDARWVIDGFNYLEAVFAPGTSGSERRAALRLHGVLWDTDLSLMGGVFERAPTAGFDLARNLGGGALRLEVVYTHPERKVWPVGRATPRSLDDFWQAVASFDIDFDLGTGVYLLAEYLFNGNGLGFGRGRAAGLLPLFESCAPPSVPACIQPASSAVFGGSQVVSGARHLTGLQLAYDLTPELRAELLTLQDWSGLSAAFVPTLRYTPLGWLELLLGVQAFAGSRRSEFGNQSEIVFLQLDLFF